MSQPAPRSTFSFDRYLDWERRQPIRRDSFAAIFSPRWPPTPRTRNVQRAERGLSCPSIA
ncbi:MAG: hypothetical protein IPL51_16575 [Candidatus Competibacteraceae bacterium]|nr:hypothetical protein [Candidatus Competibacteraceae bacterium]